MAEAIGRDAEKQFPGSTFRIRWKVKETSFSKRSLAEADHEGLVPFGKGRAFMVCLFFCGN